jgi:glutamine synthetase type III
MLCVSASDVSSPPSAGVTLTTTTAAGHTHGVTLTPAQLQQISSGQTVTVTTTLVSGHTHDFMIMKM